MFQIVILALAWGMLSIVPTKAMLERSEALGFPDNQNNQENAISLVEVGEEHFQNGMSQPARGCLSLIQEGAEKFRLLFSGPEHLKEIAFTALKMATIFYMYVWIHIFLHEMGHALTAEAIFGPEKAPINVHLAYSHEVALTKAQISKLSQEEGVTIHSSFPFDKTSYAIIPNTTNLEQSVYIRLAGPLTSLLFNFATRLWATYEENKEDEKSFGENLVKGFKNIFSFGGEHKTTETVTISLASIYGIYNSLLLNLFFPSSEYIDGACLYKALGLSEPALKALYGSSPYVLGGIVGVTSGLLVAKNFWENGVFEQLASMFDMVFGMVKDRFQMSNLTI